MLLLIRLTSCHANVNFNSSASAACYVMLQIEKQFENKPVETKEVVNALI